MKIWTSLFFLIILAAIFSACVPEAAKPAAVFPTQVDLPKHTPTPSLTPFQPGQPIDGASQSAQATETPLPEDKPEQVVDAAKVPETQEPTKVFTATAVPTAKASATTKPTSTKAVLPTTDPGKTPLPTETSKPTATAKPTQTPKPTSTQGAPTATKESTTVPTATKTSVPPTATKTSVPPTNTQAAPTATHTSPPPTATKVPPTPAPSCSPSYNGGFESEVISLVNNERAALGLSPLSGNGALGSGARTHSTDMACNNFFSHTGSDGSNFVTRVSRAGFGGSPMGEVIAAGYGSPSGVVAGWMNSPGHRDILMNPNATLIGVGYAYTSTSSYGAYWTAVTGR